jgi:transposase
LHTAAVRRLTKDKHLTAEYATTWPQYDLDRKTLTLLTYAKKLTQEPKDKGRGWVEKVLGWTVDLVERPRKPAPEEVLKAGAAEWAKAGKEVDWQKLMPPRGFQILPRKWVVERTFSWIDHNRRMSKDYERLPESSEAFIYVAMSRLMARRLARS